MVPRMAVFWHEAAPPCLCILGIVSLQSNVNEGSTPLHNWYKH